MIAGIRANSESVGPVGSPLQRLILSRRKGLGSLAIIGMTPGQSTLHASIWLEVG